MSMPHPELRPDEPRQPYDPSAVARLLVLTGEALIALLGRETELLRASKTAEIGPMIAEKTRLSQIFATGWRQFHGEPDRLGEVAVELRSQLLAVARRLNQAAIENEEVLRIGRRAAELVLAAVVRALQAKRPRIYTAGRTACIPLREHSGIGLNRSA